MLWEEQSFLKITRNQQCGQRDHDVRLIQEWKNGFSVPRAELSFIDLFLAVTEGHPGVLTALKVCSSNKSAFKCI